MVHGLQAASCKTKACALHKGEKQLLSQAQELHKETQVSGAQRFMGKPEH